ncbi:hypothetical protein G6F64_014574 [Rhizopus arrhizus]|uniref:Uncharacterized protein n=1 Tax=Rhizopus oryzae TaxID=64495 RepID=A0A9P6WT74_RHIOR|nr:hypothetical protein G6F23_014113 [Rhizopus arrhizus]KAG0752369.1 hypothetical protein G6F24_013618 [Rhizopus arrhizus]KAG1279518.1 hypothetical protein G6F64_014574 [Rhizopus arrhizus]
MSANTLPGPWPGRQILVLETADPFMLIVSDVFVEGVVVEESKSDLRFLVTTCAQDLLVDEDVADVAFDVKKDDSAKPPF